MGLARLLVAKFVGTLRRGPGHGGRVVIAEAFPQLVSKSPAFHWRPATPNRRRWMPPDPSTAVRLGLTTVSPGFDADLVRP
jgi:hypothetical protein